MKRLLQLSFILLATGPAAAACPPEMAGSTAAVIAANGQRLLCLQNEIAAASRQRQLDFDIRSLTRAQQDFRLQQRMDALPAPYVAPPQSSG